MTKTARPNPNLKTQYDNIALVCADVDLTPRARELASQLQLSLLSALPENGLVLVLDADGLSLQSQGLHSPGPLRVDFTDKSLAYRQGDKSHELILKALGINGQHKPLVWDVTAGMGYDGWILAAHGCEVDLFERHPLVHALLCDGFARILNCTDDANLRNIVGRMHLHRRDGIDALADSTLTPPDVVYIDPMFPEKRKTAKAKKAMQYFQHLVGLDEDGEALVAAARMRARFRVIVKRSPSAPVLSKDKPSAQLKGKTVRFDIYALQSPQRYLVEKNNQTR